MSAALYNDDDRRPYFFLSYARSRFSHDDGTDPDRWVTKLFQDLCYDVGIVTGTPVPGFMDRQIPAGSQWSDHLAEALAGCRVFLALLSPAYFRSEYCGKEWAAFSDRVKSQRADLDRPLAIVPVLWTRLGPAELPADVKAMQYIPPGFPPQYAAEGFYGIMKLARYREHYKQAVLQLARLVKDTAEEASLEAGPISDLNALGNAFADHHRGAPGRRSIRITVAAHRLGKLPPDRDTYYYGRTMPEWTPYRNAEYTTPLAKYAEQVVAELGHDPVIDSVDAPEADSSRSPTVLLVDPWVSRDPAITADLRRIDQDPVNVLVPFNPDDPETAEAETELDRSVDAALSRSLVLPGSVKPVSSVEAFRAALPKAVSEAMRRYIRKTPDHHPPAIGPTMARPSLKPDK